MNDPFVLRAADNMARRVFEKASSPEKRVQLAYQLAYGRQPSNREINSTRQFFERFQAEQKKQTSSRINNNRGSAWSCFCQALLCSAEFRYLN